MTARPPRRRELAPSLRGALVASLTLLGGALLTACLTSVEPRQTGTTDEPLLTGHAVRFDGRSSVRIDPEAPLTGDDGAFTLECWVRGTPPAAVQSSVAGNRHYGGFGITWSHSDLGLDRPTGWVNVTHVPGTGRAGYLLVRPARGWEWKRWTHLALTFDGRLARMYVDGALAAETVSRGEYRASRQPFFVGADPSSDGNAVQHFTGEIASLRVSRIARYTRSFTPAARPTADAQTTLLLDFEDDAEPWADLSPRQHRVNAFGSPERVRVQ